MAKTKKMKEHWRKMKAWVEERGLYPQPMGDTITNFCATFGIDTETLRDWREKEKYSEFSEMIKSANEVFANKLVKGCEVSLRKLCEGYEEWEEMQEGTPDGKSGVTIKKMTRRKKIVAPNLGAITFVLCNLQGDRWTNPLKIEAEVKGGLEVVKGMTPADAKKYLDKMNSME